MNVQLSALCAAAFCAAGTAAIGETLTVSHGYNETHVVVTDWISPWMSCVREGAGDDIEFTYYPSGQVTKNTEALEQLQSGVISVSAVSPGYHSDRMPLNSIVMLPTLGKTATSNAIAYRAQLDAGGPMLEELQNLGLVPLMVHITPPYQIISRDGRMDTLEKLASRKVRTSGGSLFLVAEGLGASPVEMPAGDVYLAIQQGTVDGAMFAALSVKPYALQEVMGAMSRNADFGNSATLFVTTTTVWDSIPEDARTILTDCGKSTELDAANKMDAQNELLLSEFSQLGVDVYDISPENTAIMNETLESVAATFVSRLDARGLPGTDVFSTYKSLIVD